MFDCTRRRKSFGGQRNQKWKLQSYSTVTLGVVPELTASASSEELFRMQTHGLSPRPVVSVGLLTRYQVLQYEDHCTARQLLTLVIL